MKKNIYILTLLLLTVIISYGQKKSVQKESKKKTQISNSLRFTTDSIDGVYIPLNLEDCIKQIDSFWPDSTKDKVRNWTENEFSGKVHLSFGMWIRNNWALWRGSRLSKYFNDLGIQHPDDMSGIILTSYYRHLNQKEIRLTEQIQYYKDYWENSNKKELERKRQEFSEYHIGDTVLYNYKLGFVTKKQETRFDEDKCIATGKILEKNDEKFWIKVLLLESCDSKGIIYYDNKNYLIYNKKTQKLEKPKKHIVKRMKQMDENWFDYDDWETLE